MMARRSSAEWSVRIGLALLVMLLGVISVAHSVARVVMMADPATAHKFAPGDGKITALLAQQSFASQPDNGDTNSTAARLARLALKQDPTTVSAVVTLGLQAQLRGDVVQMNHLLAYSEILSRRDLRTQIWAIELAAMRGNVAEAIKHYDTALRVSTTAPDLLFPVLAAATAEPAVRAELVKVLTKKPIWAALFIRFVADNARDPITVSNLYTQLQQKGMRLSDDATAVAINRLVAAGLFEEAWHYYNSVRPGVDRRQGRDPRFTMSLTTPSVLDWMPANDDSVTTFIEHGAKGGIFEFSIPSGVGGGLLRQQQLLPQGSYRLEGHATGIQQPISSMPYWTISCQNGRELGRVTMSAAGQAQGRFSGAFVVPVGCPVQTLLLTAKPSDTLSGVSGQIDQVRLIPVS